MKLYGHPASTCTRKVLTVLAEKNAAHDFVLVDIMKGEQKTPAYLARHPFGVVPAIDDNGFVLYESRAIIRYLDATLAGTSLTPADAKGRALMEQWISVESSYFSPPAMKAILNIMYASMGGKSPDLEVVEAGKAGANKALDVLEANLAGKDFLAGTFSLADITYAPYVQYMFDMNIAQGVSERPNCLAWWKRVSGRPSWQKAIGK
jgi:glutathione S-transferase